MAAILAASHKTVVLRSDEHVGGPQPAILARIVVEQEQAGVRQGTTECRKAEVQPKRHEGAARHGVKDKGEGEQVQSKRHEGAARLRGTRTRAKRSKSSRSATKSSEAQGHKDTGEGEVSGEVWPGNGFR